MSCPFLPSFFILIIMADAEKSVTINDTSYKALADGEYDVIVLGTGLKESILAGLLAVDGKKVRDFHGFNASQCDDITG